MFCRAGSERGLSFSASSKSSSAPDGSSASRARPRATQLVSSAGVRLKPSSRSCRAPAASPSFCREREADAVTRLGPRVLPQAVATDAEDEPGPEVVRLLLRRLVQQRCRLDGPVLQKVFTRAPVEVAGVVRRQRRRLCPRRVCFLCK